MLEYSYLILTSSISIFFTSYLLDNLFKICIISKARYFLLHFLFNMFIIYITYRDTIYYLVNPVILNNYYVKSAIISSSGIMSFHFYHYISSPLDIETKLHHIFSAFISAGISLCYPLGESISATNFFMCGLPGGIDYLMLVLVKYDKIDKITEKYWNRWLNLLIRMPGMLLCNWYIMLRTYKTSLIDLYIPNIAALCMTVNAIYYCNKTVGNYHICRYKKGIKIYESDS